jgi:hypothetical protein
MKAQEWSVQNPEYKKLQTKHQGELRDILKKRFDRFAILHRWNFADPSQCEFCVENLRKQGSQIPEAIEEALMTDLFIPEDFEDFVLQAAGDNSSVGKLLRELQEPRPAGQDCIPWLGETSMKERILRLCARGRIAINLRGMEYLQAHPGEDEDTAWKRLRPKLSYTGRQLDEVFLLQPSAAPTTGGTTPPMPPAGDPNGGLFGGTTPPAWPTGEQPSGVNDLGTPTGTGIFGGDTPRPHVRLSNPATSPLNLIGKLEGWGIGPATPVREVTIIVSAATGAQIKELLKKLPDGMTFELTLEKEDS